MTTLEEPIYSPPEEKRKLALAMVLRPGLQCAMQVEVPYYASDVGREVSLCIDTTYNIGPFYFMPTTYIRNDVFHRDFSVQVVVNNRLERVLAECVWYCSGTEMGHPG